MCSSGRRDERDRVLSDDACVIKYFEKHKVIDHIEDSVIALKSELPDDAMNFLGNFFLHSSSGRLSELVQTDETTAPLSVETFSNLRIERVATALNTASLSCQIPSAERDGTFGGYLNGLASTVRKGTS